jgi:hypothetical protein
MAGRVVLGEVVGGVVDRLEGIVILAVVEAVLPFAQMRSCDSVHGATSTLPGGQTRQGAQTRSLVGVQDCVSKEMPTVHAVHALHKGAEKALHSKLGRAVSR